MADDGLPQSVRELHALQAAACDWRLSRGDLGVFAVLLKHADADGCAWPGPTRISTLANLAVSNVKASLQRLESLRYIATTRPGLRKTNRYTVLESPWIPSQKTARIIESTRRDLGMRTGPVVKRSRSATRPAGRSPTRPADRSQLGMRTGHEYAFNSPKELKTASPPFSDSQEEQERSAMEADLSMGGLY